MPQMVTGGLTAYLFVADMVYAGVVEMPTADEVASTVWKLGFGGYAGLVELGLVLKKAKGQAKSQRPTCIDRFTRLYDHVYDALGDMTEILPFDPICLEHTLCKVKRFSDKGWLDFAKEDVEREVAAIVANWLKRQVEE